MNDYNTQLYNFFKSIKVFNMLTDMFKTESGIIILSILLGFGLATAFKKVCKGNNSIKEVRDTFYKIDDDCYKYTPYITKCV